MKNHIITLNKRANSIFQFTFICLLFVTTVTSLHGQTASEKNNNIPISGTDCSAFGRGALATNGAGVPDNAAMGKDALNSNSSGQKNTAIGKQALASSDADNNTAAGYQALYNNTSGHENTAVGFQALLNNTTGYENTALGYQTMLTNGTEHNNCAMGALADINTSGNYQAAIGYMALPGYGSDVVTFGDANVTRIECNQTSVTSGSDVRIKENVRESQVKGLEFIKRLRPVVYNLDTRKLTDFKTQALPPATRALHLSKDYSKSSAIRRSGFIAQEVEEAATQCGFEFKGLIKPGDRSKMYSISYAQFVMPLVKAVQEQQTMIENIEKEMASQTQRIEEMMQRNNMETGLEKMNNLTSEFSMEANRPNPFSHETVINYTLPMTITSADLIVSDLSGKQIVSFPIKDLGTSSITITSEKLSPGIYVYSMVADGKTLGSKRMIFAEQ